MEGIWITKTGFRHTEWDGSPDVQRYVDAPLGNILSHLRGACQIEDGVTLGNIIEAVAESPELCTLIGEYSWCNVRAFYAELRKPAVKPSGLKWIELSRHMEVHPGFETNIPSIGDHLDITGCDDEHSNWAIDLTPVNEMSDVPVRLNTIVKMRDWREAGKGDLPVLIEGSTCFSLLEVLSEIFIEISFHGSPESRNETISELIGMVDDLKSGKATTVPFELHKDTVQ